jgi:hypothetical protein
MHSMGKRAVEIEKSNPELVRLTRRSPIESIGVSQTTLNFEMCAARTRILGSPHAIERRIQ